MKKKIVRIVILSLMLCCVNYSNNYASWLAPDNYEDCILEGMKGVTSDVAAREIRNACRKKFPVEQEQQKSTRQLTSEELSKIEGNGGIGSDSDSKFYCELYNGNSNIVITDITIQAGTKSYTFVFAEKSLRSPTKCG